MQYFHIGGIQLLDVFTQEIEDYIKEGMSHVYWYRRDLERAWVKASVPTNMVKEIFGKRDTENRKLTKRQLMNELYFKLRKGDFNKRLY